VRPPTFSGFAAKIGVRPETLWIWAKEHTEFGEAAARAKAMQEDALIALGAAGAFDSRFVALIMKNLHGWQDRVEQTNRGAVTLVFDAQDKEA
jgi:hypothetical protein